MKYQDNANSVNGFYVGESAGSRLADSLTPDDDGLDYMRGVDHVGTILGDAADPNFPELITESEEKNNGEDTLPKQAIHGRFRDNRVRERRGRN